MADSRYNIDNFIVALDKSFISANITRLKEVSTNVITVSPGLAHRLDLLSDLLYNTVALKWVLMYVNDVFDVSMVDFGFVLKYPSLRDILAVMNETGEFK